MRPGLLDDQAVPTRATGSASYSPHFMTVTMRPPICAGRQTSEAALAVAQSYAGLGALLTAARSAVPWRSRPPGRPLGFDLLALTRSGVRFGTPQGQVGAQGLLSTPGRGTDQAG